MEKSYDFNIHSELRRMLQEVADINFMLMRNFNYSNINWGSNVWESCASVDIKMLMDCDQDLFLTQHVNCLTTDKLWQKRRVDSPSRSGSGSVPLNASPPMWAHLSSPSP